MSINSLKSFFNKEFRNNPAINNAKRAIVAISLLGNFVIARKEGANIFQAALISLDSAIGSAVGIAVGSILGYVAGGIVGHGAGLKEKTSARVGAVIVGFGASLFGMAAGHVTTAKALLSPDWLEKGSTSLNIRVQPDFNEHAPKSGKTIALTPRVIAQYQPKTAAL